MEHGFVDCSFSIIGKTKGGRFCSRVVSTAYTISFLFSLFFFFFPLSFSVFEGVWYSSIMHMPLRSKLHNYDEVVERVAQQVGLDDPSKIRLTSHNCYSQQPKPQPIKFRGVERLSDMLVHYNQVEFSWLYVHLIF